MTRRSLPPSLYSETARPAVDTPPLDGDRRVDVAVVGGGFTGLSTALHLAENGVDVAVLEAHEPGWGASGRNGGQLNPGLKHDPDQVEADFGTDLGGRMISLSYNAPDFAFRLIERHQIECDALQSGTLRAAYQRRTGDDVRRSAEQGMRRGLPVQLLERAAVQQATGSDRYLCAMLQRQGGQVNPLSYARGLAQAAMRMGASVHGATPALGLERNGKVWRIKTPTGTLSADKVVLATNGYSDNLWPKLRRTIVPVFSAIVASERLPEDIARSIMPDRSVLYEMGSITVYYRLDRDNRLLMGGRSRQRDDTTPGELRYLVDYAGRLWPAVRGAAWTHGWNGQVAVTPDHYPHVHEPDESILVCLGYNGRGVALSTAMGPQLARRTIGGKSAEIDMPITTMKQIPWHGLWRSAVTARLVYGRIQDSLGL